MLPLPAFWISRVCACLLLLAACACRQKPKLKPESAPQTTRLLFGGDVMLSRNVARIARQQNDPAFPFRAIAPVLASADIAFANLESPFSDRGRRTLKGMVFKAEPEMIEGLKLAGFDVLSTANNHSRDSGERGLVFTLEWLTRHGIAAAGTGQDAASAHAGAVLERNGTRFGFLAYTYDQRNGNHPDDDGRIAMLDAHAMANDVCQLKARAEVVIVSMHAGIEYQPKPNRQQIEFARAAIDAGAAIVVGHHPHVIQPVERYKEGVIFYSLGNLVFDQFHRKETQQSLLAEVTFLGGRMQGYALKPVQCSRTVPSLTLEQ